MSFIRVMRGRSFGDRMNFRHLDKSGRGGKQPPPLTHTHKHTDTYTPKKKIEKEPLLLPQMSEWVWESELQSQPDTKPPVLTSVSCVTMMLP